NQGNQGRRVVGELARRIAELIDQEICPADHHLEPARRRWLRRHAHRRERHRLGRGRRPAIPVHSAYPALNTSLVHSVPPRKRGQRLAAGTQGRDHRLAVLELPSYASPRRRPFDRGTQRAHAHPIAPIRRRLWHQYLLARHTDRDTWLLPDGDYRVVTPL